MKITEFKDKLSDLALDSQGLYAMLSAIEECIENGPNCAEDYAPALFVICNIVGKQASAISILSETEVTL